MQADRRLITLVCFSAFLASTFGIKCYVCTSSQVRPDVYCETGDVTHVPAVKCPDAAMYCYVKRYKWHTVDGADDMLRGCTDTPEFRNGEYQQQNGSVTISYESCGLDLCNSAGTTFKQDGLLALSLLFSFALVYLVR